MEYNDGDEEDFDVTELKKGIQLYNSVEKNDSCITSENTVINLNEFMSMKENTMDYIDSCIAKRFDDAFYIGLITNYKVDLWHVEYEWG